MVVDVKWKDFRIRFMQGQEVRGLLFEILLTLERVASL